MLRKIIPAGALLVLLTMGLAFAQVVPLPDNKIKPTKEEQDRATADKAYRDATTRVPIKNSTDPWGSVRPSAPAPSVAAKNKQ
jgi:hypothetical protein